MDFGTVEIELVGVIIVLITGFGGIFYRLGRREQTLEDLAGAVKENQERIEAHETKCDERNAKIDNRLAHGSTEMALMKQTSEGNSQKLESIEGLLLKLLTGEKK